MSLIDPQVQVGLYRQQQQQKQQQASNDFWATQGYPQYAGKYTPVNVPPGYRIQGVQEKMVSGLPPGFVGPPMPSEMVQGLEVTLVQQQPSPKTDWLSSPITVGSMGGLIPTALGIKPLTGIKTGVTLPVSHAEALEIVGIAGVAIVAPAVLPFELGISTPTLLAVAGVSIAVPEAYSYATTGQAIPLNQILPVALFGEAFYVGISAASLGGKALDKIVEKLPFMPKYGAISPGLTDIPDIGIVGPRTMSEKVLGLNLESPYQVSGLKALEAETTATSFGTVPRTALLDPLGEMFELPTLDKPISGMPYIPHPELTAKLDVFEPEGLMKNNFMSLLALPQTKSQSFGVGVSRLLTRNVPTIAIPKFDFKMSSKLSQDLISVPVQATKTTQLTQTIQKQITVPQFLTLTVPTFQTQQLGLSSFGGGGGGGGGFALPKNLRRLFYGKAIWSFPVAGSKKLMRELF